MEDDLFSGASLGGEGVDFADALSKCLLFLEAQRSGKLPSSNRVPWRSDSGLSDGADVGLDLTGGYYDAGDNVKFVFPMAFTVTMLSWGVVEYSHRFRQCGELDNALDAIRWGTDFFIKAHPSPCELYAAVGDGESDHARWMRPENMTTSRAAYKVDANKPGTEVAAEVAAAMAAAAIAFRESDEEYAVALIMHAKQLFCFADSCRACYSDSMPSVQPFYKSWNGFYDELLWAAIWLYRATEDVSFMNYLTGANSELFGGTVNNETEFSWDNKLAGVQVLMARALLMEEDGCAEKKVLEEYKEKADGFMVRLLQGRVQRTPGGLVWVRADCPLQYAGGAAFLAMVYADVLIATDTHVQFDGCCFSGDQLLEFACSQVSYVLGNNPRCSSYMVGVGRNWPQHVHHRGSSIPGGYTEGFKFLHSKQPNPNPAVGAIVGGPDALDCFEDNRENHRQSEPTTYINAIFCGLLARFAELHQSAGLQDEPCRPAGQHTPFSTLLRVSVTELPAGEENAEECHMATAEEEQYTSPLVSPCSDTTGSKSEYQAFDSASNASSQPPSPRQQAFDREESASVPLESAECSARVDRSFEGGPQVVGAAPAACRHSEATANTCSSQHSENGAEIPENGDAQQPPPPPPPPHPGSPPVCSRDARSAPDLPGIIYSITKESEWVEGGKRIAVLQVDVTNGTGKAIEDLLIKPSGFAPSQFWCIELVSETGLLKLPTWKPVLQPSEVFRFGLIQPCAPALRLQSHSYAIVED